jgi:hypothetical protein
LKQWMMEAGRTSLWSRLETIIHMKRLSCR